MSGSNSRKRAAPGASPMAPGSQQQMQQPYMTGNSGHDPLIGWNLGNEAMGFPAGNGYEMAQAPSNALARRQANTALVPTNTRTGYNTSVEPWTGVGDDISLLPHDDNDDLVEEDSVEVLEEMAQKAKREAQAKRKQIPPFVQKLSSFLEEGKNEDLIRWSQKGDSFVVLDEDEFAKTLIPELFKHNNYASFVRQLNMYGFHKRVGLSDNSMRASERKNKSPSEYSNPFFRRGHPNLLWLINKPKGKSKKGSKNDGGEADSDDEVAQEDGLGQGLGTSNMQTASRSLPAAESQPIQKKEMTIIREELGKLRDQQKMILGAINRLQRNNNDLYNQALMFQSQHDRHQNSINAILNFLANVFRKTLEDQGSTQNVGDIISSMISSQGQQSSHLGNIVDLGDFVQSQAGHTPAMGGPPKRARGLLPPIPEQSSNGQSSRVQSVASTGSTPYYGAQNPEMGHVTELADGQLSDTPPDLRQELQNNPHERMMKIINDHNATNTSGLDLPEAAEFVANAPNALNHDERSKLANLMVGQSASPGDTASTDAARDLSKNMPSMRSNTSISPPPDLSTAPSLSPIMRSPQMVPPSLNEISTNGMDLEHLQRLQSEQDAKISEIGELLGPLSPSGHVPGLNDPSEPQYFDQNVDLDQYFDSNAFLNDTSFDGDGDDFNFNLGGDGTGGHIDSGSPDGTKAEINDYTPSPSGTEEITRDDLDTNEDAGQGNKRRRVN